MRTLVHRVSLLVLILILVPTTLSTTFGQLTSTNWAGYAISSNSVTAIGASWSIPYIQCANTVGGTTITQGISVWVGFDALTGAALVPEQAGTESFCLNGSANYLAWEEDPTTGAGSSNHAVVAMYQDLSAGDHIAASISYLGTNHFQLKIVDSNLSDGRTYSVIIPNAPRASAEWIVEAFTNLNTGKQVTVPKFQPVTFSDCSAAVNDVVSSITQLSGQSISMTDNNGKIIVAPQGLNQAGTSFQVAEVASAVPETPYIGGLLLPALVAGIFLLRRKRLTNPMKNDI